MFGSEALNPMQPRFWWWHLLMFNYLTESPILVTQDFGLAQSDARGRFLETRRLLRGPSPASSALAPAPGSAEPSSRSAHPVSGPRNGSPAPLRSRRPTERSGDRGLAAEAPAAGGGRVT